MNRINRIKRDNEKHWHMPMLFVCEDKSYIEKNKMDRNSVLKVKLYLKII